LGIWDQAIEKSLELLRGCSGFELDLIFGRKSTQNRKEEKIDKWDKEEKDKPQWKAERSQPSHREGCADPNKRNSHNQERQEKSLVLRIQRQKRGVGYVVTRDVPRAIETEGCDKAVEIVFDREKNAAPEGVGIAIHRAFPFPKL